MRFYRHGWQAGRQAGRQAGKLAGRWLAGWLDSFSKSQNLRKFLRTLRFYADGWLGICFSANDRISEELLMAGWLRRWLRRFAAFALQLTSRKERSVGGPESVNP